MTREPTALPRDGYALLGVIVALQLNYTSRDGNLLSRRELILASGASRTGGGALSVFGIDGDFGGIVAVVNDICPARRGDRGGIGEDLDVRHGALGVVQI